MKNKKKLYIGLAIALAVIVIGGYTINSENFQGKFKLDMDKDASLAIIKTESDTSIKTDLGITTLATITTVDTPEIMMTKDDIGDQFLLGTWRIKYGNSVPYGSDEDIYDDINFGITSSASTDIGTYFGNMYIEITDAKTKSVTTIENNNGFSLKNAGITKGGTYTISLYGKANSKLSSKTITPCMNSLLVAGRNGDKFQWYANYADSFDNERFKIVGLTESEIIGSNGIPGRTIEYTELDDSESIMFIYQDVAEERSYTLSTYEEIFLAQFDLILKSPDYTDEDVTTGLTFAAYDSEGTQQTLDSYFDTIRVVLTNCDTFSGSQDLTGEGDLSSYEFELHNMMTEKYNGCYVNIYGTPNTTGMAFFQGQSLYVSKVKLEIPGGSTTYWTPSNSYASNHLFSLNPTKAGRGMPITEMTFK